MARVIGVNLEIDSKMMSSSESPAGARWYDFGMGARFSSVIFNNLIHEQRKGMTEFVQSWDLPRQVSWKEEVMATHGNLRSGHCRGVLTCCQVSVGGGTTPEKLRIRGS